MAKFSIHRPGFEAWPEDLPHPDEWRIFRVPAASFGNLVIVSVEPVSRYTHYFCRRTTPCALPDPCAACDADNARRGHSWMAVVSLKTSAKHMLQLTHRAMGFLAPFKSRKNGLRGLCMRVARDGSGRPNGKVCITPYEPKTPYDLPDAPNLESMLCRMWEAPRPIPQGASQEQKLMDQAAQRRLSS